MRILHVVSHLGTGGMERVLFTLLREQQQLGVEIQLCVLGTENAFPERLEGLGRVDFLGYDGSLKDVRGMWRTIGKLRQKIREYQPDVVHAHLWPTARLVASAMAGMAPQLLVHIHDTRDWLAGTGWRDRMLRQMTRRAFHIRQPRFVAVSQACRAYTQEHLPWLRGEIPVVPNAFDARDFETADAASDSAGRAAGRPLIVGSAGRLSEEKGHEFLIRAVALLRDRGVDVELRIAGSGGLGSRYEQIISELELGDRVELVGKVADMQAFYQGLDVYCQPSTGGEGMPIVILEAMAMNLPIVSTDIAGAPEVVEDGEHGLLVPPSNPPALAAAIERLHADSAMRTRLAANARRRALHDFTGRRMAERIVAIYQSMFSQSGASEASVPGERNAVGCE
ncbi:MAG: glycosyltransferase family 4 protein [Phycisphaeraceae bacterium]